jgi:hypothetical protein
MKDLAEIKAKLNDILARPYVKDAIKYGALALAVMDFLKTLAEFSDTLHKDKGVLVLVSHFLWRFLRFILEFFGLTIFAFGILSVALKIVTLGIIDILESDEHDVVTGAVFITAICGAIWLDFKYGFIGTFKLVGAYILQFIKHQLEKGQPCYPHCR